ncbi:chaperonin 10-like protein [Exophiala viscosa]|uniref:Chaperonin 10-like protein n=1 Tax=Exophiala viscosa TaxID=2486360 RepID=A0AAN6DZL5_9EURO|nr:chaperonin 10-like protein [Exophiala viscosa]
MATHAAVVTVGPGLPLEIHQVPTPKPVGAQVRVRSEWTASTPLDLHQADGGLLVTHPLVLGDGVAGTVVDVGPDVTLLRVGDKVFGFTWRNQAEKAHQEYVVAPEFLFGKLPDGVTMQQAVTLPNNFVTAWHTFTKHFGFELPWPNPEGYVPKDADEAILIWGGSSSVGQYAIQILKWYGYKNVIATASRQHHDKLRRYGAVKCFDYRDVSVIEEIKNYATGRATRPGIPYILDCIGSLAGSVRPLAKIAESGSKVAVLLPIIVKDAAVGIKPEYSMDVEGCADWQPGVEALGVRTHFYIDNKFLAEHLQSEIMPTLLAKGVIEANEQIVVEGQTLLERAEKALSMLRNKAVSGARLVWRVSDEKS